MSPNAKAVLRSVYQTGLTSGRGIEVTVPLPANVIVTALNELLDARYVTNGGQYARPHINSFRSTYFAPLSSRREEAESEMAQAEVAIDPRTL